MEYKVVIKEEKNKIMEKREFEFELNDKQEKMINGIALDFDCSFNEILEVIITHDLLEQIMTEDLDEVKQTIIDIYFNEQILGI